jgi:crotonobetaine/carnitine-CoA ligase
MEEYLGFQERFGLKITTTYNMTEISSPISQFDVTDPRSCGRVVAGCDVRVVDQFDNEVAPGVVGELVVRSDEPWTMMTGYLGDSEKTASAWRNLWFHTGDAFVRGEDGRFYFKDRLTDSIRRRAESISSMDVEAEILAHPEVKAAAVIGVPAEFGDEEIMSFVVTDASGELTESRLITYLEDRMPRFMVPRYIKLVDSLPLTPSGKVEKYALRGMAVTDRGWDRFLATPPP